MPLFKKPKENWEILRDEVVDNIIESIKTAPDDWEVRVIWLIVSSRTEVFKKDNFCITLAHEVKKFTLEYPKGNTIVLDALNGKGRELWKTLSEWKARRQLEFFEDRPAPPKG